MARKSIERPARRAAGLSSAAVFESAWSTVFEQAENRLRTIKAVLVATLASG